MSAEMRPEERVFRDHIEQGSFQSGVDRGRWRFISIEWPYSVIAVSAAERPKGPREYGFRFELSDYPQTPPTAQPWDVEKRRPLSLAGGLLGAPASHLRLILAGRAEHVFTSPATGCRSRVTMAGEISILQ